jgi:hypothetical protein
MRLDVVVAVPMFDPLQVDTTVRGMVNVPATVGVPAMVLNENNNPPGSEVDVTENVFVPVEEAVSPYENAWPTIPDAVREDVNCGARHVFPGTTLTTRLAVAVAPCESDTR